MENQVRKQIKLLLVQEDLKLKDLAILLGERLGKNYSYDGLSHRIGRKTLSYDEMLLIADILGYDINFVKRQTELDKMR